MFTTALSSPERASAQCTSLIHSTGQSITVNSTGGGTFPLNFNQYNPPAGYVLVSAVLKSYVTMTASFQLTNNQTSDLLTKVSANDEDEITLNGTDIFDPFGDDISDVLISKPNVGSALVPGNGGTATVGPASVFNNTNAVNDSITTAYGALNSFVGTGTVNMAYNVSAGYGANQPVNVNPTYAISTVVTLDYYWCYTGNLAANILNFTATKENNNTVDLDWITGNETAGSQYIVEMSPSGGTTFTDLGTVIATSTTGNGAYSFVYNIQPSDTGRIYFRLKLVDLDGTIAYSPLRSIDLGAGSTGGFTIYPNPPSSYINLQLSAGDWQVDIFAADGNLVQRNYFTNTINPRIDFARKLASGGYFVRVTNAVNGEKHNGSFVIR